MATIQFSNGHTVQFNGTPTQQDIEQLGVKMGLHTPTPSQPPAQSNPLGGYGNQVMAASQSGVDKIKQSLTGTPTGMGDLLSRGLGVVGGLAGIASSPLAPIGNAIGKVTNKVDFSDNPAVQRFANSKAGETTQRIAQGVSDFAAGTGVVAGGLEAPEALNTAVTKGTGLLDEGISRANARSATTSAAADATKINEMISPKLTPKEQELAQSQGRIYPGKPGGILKNGTPDRIATSDKTFNATQTIIKAIPNAAKMSPSELYGAVRDAITKIAQKLRPQMEATPIKPEIITKINTDWEAIKSKQLEDAPATEEANVSKRQAKFESFLKKSGNGTHADLWDTRIKYDDSIPPNVKKANINSPESLQLQKAEWLQNRQILNDAINDSTSGMGQASQQAFSNMSNLYEAQNNLLGKTKINTVGQPSKLNQFLDTPAGKTIKGAVKLGVGGKLLGL